MLTNVSTEPAPRSSYSNNREFRPEDLEKPADEARPSDPSTAETVVGRQSSRQPSEELKQRRRFIQKGWFKKNKENEVVDGEEKPKKKGGIFRGKDLKHEPFTLRNQLANTIFNSWINLLLIAAPVGIALNYAGVNRIAVFVVNFIAIIPLAALLSFATEEIALHVGESLGGLLNASFGYVLHFSSP